MYHATHIAMLLVEIPMNMLPRRCVWLLAAVVCACAGVGTAFAQSSFDLTGRVTDAATGEGLPGVHVFLASRLQGTTTDAEGAYVIDRVEPGAYRIVASMVGYQAVVQTARLTGDASAYRLDFQLQPTVYSLDSLEVVDEVPREWLSQLALFETYFLGRSANARLSTIENPEVLEFVDDDAGFHAYAAEPLIIENRGLGFKVTFLLTTFRVEKTTGLRYTDGFWRLEELEPESEDEEERWRERRELTFQGSLQHLLWSMIRGRDEEEGFSIDLDRRENAPFAVAFTSELERVESDSLIARSDATRQYVIRFPGYLRVDYFREEDSAGFFRRRGRPPRRQISYLKLNAPEVNVHRQGYVFSLGRALGMVTAYGYMASQGAADLLPQEYADLRWERLDGD